jgi:Cu2+-exporting ATPase
MVSDAAASKAPIAKVADKVSGIFVPAVITIALITVIVWLLVGQTAGFAIARGISVLVISCPCALGLATPVAIMVGNGMGAKHGILFKTAVALEETGKAGIVVLDKTGTITEGKPQVTDIIPCMTDKDNGESRLLSLAYGLEKRSEHPLATAINSEAERRKLTAADVTDFKALPGNGLTARAEGHMLYGGNREYISKYVDIPQKILDTGEKLSSEGKTPLFFAHDKELYGIIAVADVVKADSPQAIEEMKKMGIHVVMLTGDNQVTAEAIGKQAGVDEVIAGVLPEGKERAIVELKKKGKVIMVGDGINDAPALTRADIGMAIGAGTDVAIDAADIVLMKSRLSDVPAAIGLSRATLRNIHENLFWAFIYNVIGIPLAAGVFIHALGWQLNPMFAAAAMSLSSFSVVTNALRLNLYKINNKDLKENVQAEKEKHNMKKTLNIEGMMCGHCEAHVKKALEALSGVSSAEVSHEAGTAVVELTENVADDILTSAVTEAGYSVKSIS